MAKTILNRDVNRTVDVQLTSTGRTPENQATPAIGKFAFLLWISTEKTALWFDIRREHGLSTASSRA
jgi:hypothetical protein